MSDPNTSSKVQSTRQSAPELDAQTNAEIDAAMAEMNALADAPKAPALGGKPAIRGPRVVQAGREHRTGTVVSVGPTDIFVEFGPKELGVAPKLGWPEEALPKAGDQIELVIDRFESGDNVYICSRPGSVQKADWEMLEPGQVIEARVASVVKGGLELEVAQHRAFMPAGQVGLDRVEDQSIFIGEKFKCKVIRVDRAGRGNIVLSRREVLIEERKANAEQLKGKLAEGMTVEGVVRKIMPFGAFVDLGGLDGLIHISDLSHDRVGFGEKAVAKHVQEGQKVTVKILKLDLENDRISLGLKQNMADPFAQATEAVQEGAQLTGRVTKILEFGAFVEVAPGVEGLVHISEIDYKRIASVADALKVDEVVQVKVLKIDPGNRRISLSIKATKEAPKYDPPEGGAGGGGGRPGRPDRKGVGGRSAEEILKETPALRRLREKNKKVQFKGGLG
jgi:small subunit ribosomal protein S1